jgi:hypothetical protein
MGSSGGVRYFSVAAGVTVPLYVATPVKALTIGPAAIMSSGANTLLVSKPLLDLTPDDGQ